MSNLINWIDKNIKGYEVYNKTSGGKIIFVPVENDNKIRQHLRRTKQNIKTEYRANYTSIAIFE